ncbi:hypothetical protein GCM10027399_14340 [Curvibacter fontanus]|uniref:hypothetical protein n=1 Tax=Hydrogenophaga sp. TaxID=1904254 RepID=UPI00271E434B|nr:hypothetical protein [Hydrogenophaga sp.]MDO9220923.1 hypothetical protein [Thiobacillus sp.]MDP1619590.1 hypothetical protein [bacterium]MDP1936167.1 hypothetical protein [Hylemonella sp.]MDZ4102469.1 hypothetical protein [Hydrogenophaga sp.]
MSKKSTAATAKKSSTKTSSPKAAQGISPEFIQTAVAMRMTRRPSDWAPTPEQNPSGQPAVVHDFAGHVLFLLPSSLKETLGEAVFNACVADLEDHEMTAIHREKDTVTYIGMKCIAQMYAPPKTPAAEKKGRGKRAA